MLKIINWFVEKLFPQKIERNEVIKLLTEQVDKLKETNIISLMKERRINELEKIAQEMEVSNLKKFVKEQNALLELMVKEIPKNACIEAAFYLSRSGCEDIFIFDNFDEFYFLLISEGGEIGSKLANILDTKDLCDLKVKDFVM